MGLKYPSNLEDWSQWQMRQSRIRQLHRALARPTQDAPLILTVRGGSPRILVAVESTTPSTVAANLAPVYGIADSGLAIVSPAPIEHLLPHGSWKSVEIPAGSSSVPEILAGVKVILASGHYLPAGAKSLEWATRLGIRLTVIQHGLLTPFAPPLPPNAHLLAFSPQDADFWRSDRNDVTSDVVGSQLLWNASTNHGPPSLTDEAPLFLGQLHGAELARRDLVRTTQSFCLSTGATYRPHPAEVDKLSRLQHAYWKNRGIHIDSSRQSFSEISRPVVAIFSTGVLEAAARGLPAWVTYRGRPPAWLSEFWDRYNLSPWGKKATAVPECYEIEPAVAITKYVKMELGTEL